MTSKLVEEMARAIEQRQDIGGIIIPDDLAEASLNALCKSLSCTPEVLEMVVNGKAVIVPTTRGVTGKLTRLEYIGKGEFDTMVDVRIATLNTPLAS